MAMASVDQLQTAIKMLREEFNQKLSDAKGVISLGSSTVDEGKLTDMQRKFEACIQRVEDRFGSHEGAMASQHAELQRPCLAQQQQHTDLSILATGVQTAV